MKKCLHLLVALTLAHSAFGQASKPAPGTAAKPAEAAKPATKEEAKEPAKDARPLPMNARVDEIDAAGKTFTQNTRDGRKVKHVITSKTDIKQGRDSAKFEDIKVGDMVAGSRLKKTADGTEYEVIKITKFGPKPTKPAKDETPEKK